MAFIDGVKERAKQSKKTIVLPEGNDIRVIVAAEKIMKEELADLLDPISNQRNRECE